MTDINDAFESWYDESDLGSSWFDNATPIESKTSTFEEFKSENPKTAETLETDFKETIISNNKQYSTIQNNLNDVINTLETKLKNTNDMAERVSLTQQIESTRNTLNENINHQFSLTDQHENINKLTNDISKLENEYNTQSSMEGRIAVQNQIRQTEDKLYKLQNDFKKVRREKINSSLLSQNEKYKIGNMIDELEEFENKNKNLYDLNIEESSINEYESLATNNRFQNFREYTNNFLRNRRTGITTAEETTSLLAEETIAENRATVLNAMEEGMIGVEELEGLGMMEGATLADVSTILSRGLGTGLNALAVAYSGYELYEIVKGGIEKHMTDKDSKYTAEELRGYDVKDIANKWWEGTGKWNEEREKKGLPTGFVDDAEKNPMTDLGKLFYETNKRSNQMNEYIDKENHFYEKFKQLVLNDKTEFKQFSKLPTTDDKQKFLDYYFPYETTVGNKYDLFNQTYKSHHYLTRDYRLPNDWSIIQHQFNQVKNDKNIPKAVRDKLKLYEYKTMDQKDNVRHLSYEELYLKNRQRYYKEDVKLFNKILQYQYKNDVKNKARNKYLTDRQKIKDEIENEIRKNELNRLKNITKNKPKEQKNYKDIPITEDKTLHHHRKGFRNEENTKHRKGFRTEDIDKSKIKHSKTLKVLENFRGGEYLNSKMENIDLFLMKHDDIYREMLLELCEDSKLSYSDDIIEGSKLISNLNSQCRIYNKNGYINVCFRGSEIPTSFDGFKDWVDDFNGRGVNLSSIFTFIKKDDDFIVHSGFLNHLSNIYEDVKREILKYDGEFNLGSHSLGGAISLIFAYIFYLETGKTPTFFYTFGCPRVFKGNIRKFDEIFNMVRVSNLNDVFTYLPPKEMGYNHCGTLLLLNGDKNIKLNREFSLQYRDNIFGKEFSIDKNYLIIKEGVDILRNPIDLRGTVADSLYKTLAFNIFEKNAINSLYKKVGTKFLENSRIDRIKNNLKFVYNKLFNKESNYYDVLQMRIKADMASKRKDIPIPKIKYNLYDFITKYLEDIDKIDSPIKDEFKNWEKDNYVKKFVEISNERGYNLEQLEQNPILYESININVMNLFFDDLEKIEEKQYADSAKLDNFISLTMISQSLYSLFTLYNKVDGHLLTNYIKNIKLLPTIINEFDEDNEPSKLIDNSNNEYYQSLENRSIFKDLNNEKYRLFSNNIGGYNLHKMDNEILGFYFYNKDEEINNKIIVF